MISVVCDSNIYVSAVVFGGNPRAVLELAEHGLFYISVSYPIKAEVERILALKFAWPDKKIEDVTTQLWILAHSTVPQQDVHDCSDPDDNRVLECAIEA